MHHHRYECAHPPKWSPQQNGWKTKHHQSSRPLKPSRVMGTGQNEENWKDGKSCFYRDWSAVPGRARAGVDVCWFGRSTGSQGDAAQVSRLRLTVAIIRCHNQMS